MVTGHGGVLTIVRGDKYLVGTLPPIANLLGHIPP